MSGELFFKNIEDLEPRYVQAKIFNLVEQIGSENLAALGVTEIEIGAAKLSGMQGAGCILYFAEMHNECNAIGIVLFCDSYQVAAGKATRDKDGVNFEVKNLHSDTDCFSLNDVLGSIRGIKLPYRYESETRCETSENGVFFMEVTGKHVLNQ